MTNDGADATSPLLWGRPGAAHAGMFSEDDAGSNLYYEPDALGSSVGLLDVNASQHITYEYDAFGEVLGTDGTYPVSHPLEEGFAGGAGYQEEYGTGGLIRCGNRYYNPYFGGSSPKTRQAKERTGTPTATTIRPRRATRPACSRKGETRPTAMTSRATATD